MSGKPYTGKCYKWLIVHKDIEQEECLTWPFAKFTEGYGYIKLNGKGEYAHRIMCKLKHGPPFPDKPYALHTCNKGDEACVNPNHVYWGNQSENMIDKYRANRLLVK